MMIVIELVSTTRRPVGPVIRSHSSRQMLRDGHHDYSLSSSSLPNELQTHPTLLYVLLSLVIIFVIT